MGLLALFCSSLKSMDAFALRDMIAISAQDLSQEKSDGQTLGASQGLGLCFF